MEMLHGGCILYLLAITLIHRAAPASLFRSVMVARLGVVLLSGCLLLPDFGGLVELYIQVVLSSGLIFVEYRIYRGKDAVPSSEQAEVSD